MATAKSASKIRQRTPRPGKRLGFKIFGGQKVKIGDIILRQRGCGFHAGEGVGRGKDHTLFALKVGIVQFEKKKGKTQLSVI